MSGKPQKGTHRKELLPHKTCLQCGLPFVWRKKWARVWDEVKYCSDRCRNEHKKASKEIKV
ncbi:MAG: DUF2256 domain-containing protein [Flavipsychrobacter sp.]|nr:DUF2256 domain-containing protein [Flavipsychrobacter sp.]